MFALSELNSIKSVQNTINYGAWVIISNGGGGWLDLLKLRLTQPQVELEAWAELGNIQ